MLAKGGRVLLAALLAVSGFATLRAVRRYTRYAVAGESMVPTLHDGDWLVIDTRPGGLREGDVVLASDPREPARVIVKRVAAREGDALVLLGDNPEASTDSRHYGPVPRALVIGRVAACYWPWDRRRRFRR